MRNWERPLTNQEIAELIKVNKQNGPVEVMDGPIGLMVKVTCSDIQICHSSLIKDKTFYCGGNSNLWFEETEFFKAYPQYDKRQIMLSPMFDLEDMELAEILIEEMKT